MQVEAGNGHFRQQPGQSCRAGGTQRHGHRFTPAHTQTKPFVFVNFFRVCGGGGYRMAFFFRQMLCNIPNAFCSSQYPTAPIALTYTPYGVLHRTAAGSAHTCTKRSKKCFLPFSRCCIHLLSPYFPPAPPPPKKNVCTFSPPNLNPLPPYFYFPANLHPLPTALNLTWPMLCEFTSKLRTLQTSPWKEAMGAWCVAGPPHM